MDIQRLMDPPARSVLEPPPEHELDKNAKKRRRIYLQQDRKCWWCKRIVTWAFCTIDYIIPRSAGGSNHHNNLVVACWECNQKKANKDPNWFCKKTGALNPHVRVVTGATKTANSGKVVGLIRK